MPDQLDKCVKAVKKSIASGKTKKTYIDKRTGKRVQTNPWAICKAKYKYK